MTHRIVVPRIMEIGAGARFKLAEILQVLNCKNPLIITDKMMVQLGYVAEIQTVLDDAGMNSDVFAETVPEPTSASIQAGVAKVKAGNYDAIVALGGGSPIDSAKAISVLGKKGGSIRDYRFPHQENDPALPIIAIPTTAGTGSEATRFTIITDETSDEKLLCAGLAYMPVAALVDYELTISVPARTTADTGIDALTHAMEAYVSQKANLYSDQQALAAMTLIGANLKTAYADGSNRSAREAMMLGSLLAGIAFSNSSVALVHGMSRPIGAFFHVPHGLSNAMLLPMVTEFSIPAAPAKYANCARAIGVAEQNDSDDCANQKLVAALYDINRELKVPTLAEFGVSKDNFDKVVDTMAQQAQASGSPANNPRQPTIEEMKELYAKLWA